MVAKACRIASQEGFALPGSGVIISAGVPLGTPGATNMLRIALVGEDEIKATLAADGPELDVLAFDVGESCSSAAPRLLHGRD